MSEPIANPYLVLGVERTADERAIKKAYFALVRKFPPDTHAAEFQGLRAAYELLSDAAARERYDRTQTGYSEYAPAVAERLKAADEAQKQDKSDLARTIYMELLVADPKLTVARSNLALSWYRSGNLAAGLAELDVLVAEEPDNAHHHFYRGIGLGRLKRPGEAERSLRRAVELESGNLQHRAALIDCLIAAGKTNVALLVIAEGEKPLDVKAPGRITLALRRVEALAADAATAVALDQALGGLDALVRDLADPELPAYLASQLAGSAARLFADNRQEAADGVLAACHRLHPVGRVERPIPVARSVRVKDLPEPAQRWLKERKQQKDPALLQHVRWPAPLLLLGLSAVIAACVIDSLVTPQSWTAGDWLANALWVTPCLCGVLLGLRQIARLLASPVRPFTTLHPLYVVQIRGDRVRLHSLLHLVRAGGTHHHTNGVYTRTSINLSFSGAAASISIRGKQEAERWLQLLSARRNRTLNVLGNGLIEAEHGMDGLTPAELERFPAERRGLASLVPGRDGWRLGVASLALALVVLPVMAWRSAVACDDAAISSALSGGTVEALQGYLEARPNGRYVKEAQREIDARFAAAERSYRLVARERAAGGAGLVDALGRLRVARRGEVPVVVRLDGEATSDSDEARRLAGWLGRLAGSAGLDGVLRFKAMGEGAAAAAPVRIELALARATGQLFVAEHQSVPARAWRGRMALVAAGGEALVAPAEAEVPPPDEIEIEEAGAANLPAAVEQRLRRLAIARIATDFARALGIAGAPLEPRAAAEPLSARNLPNPYSR